LFPVVKTPTNTIKYLFKKYRENSRRAENNSPHFPLTEKEKA